jgi:hypothetical protein
MAETERVFLYDFQRLFRGNETTGFTLTAQYDGTEAEVQIRLATPLAASSSQDDAIAELHRLGEALQKAAQSPQTIFWQRPDRP